MVKMVNMSTLVKMLKKCPIPSVLIVSPVRWWRPQISLSRLLWWSSFSRSLFRSFFATSNNAFFCLTWGFLQTGRNDQTFGWPPEHQQGWRWTESTPRGADWFCYSGRSLLLSLWKGSSFCIGPHAWDRDYSWPKGPLLAAEPLQQLRWEVCPWVLSFEP